MNKKSVFVLSVLLLALMMMGGCFTKGYTISGSVSSLGIPLSNVRVVATGRRTSVTNTGDDGKWKLVGIPERSIVTPVLYGCTFTPSCYAVSGHESNMDFDLFAYRDDFSFPGSGWRNEGASVYEDGTYKISGNISIRSPFYNPPDCFIKVTICSVYGAGNAGLGISIPGYETQIYSFTIDPASQQVCIKGSTPDTVLDITSTEISKTGPNVLGINYKEHSAVFTINGNVIHQIDQSMTSGEVVVDLRASSGTTAWLDDFSLIPY